MSDTGNSSTLGSFFRRRKDKLGTDIGKLTRVTNLAHKKPLHPGAFTESDDVGVTFASPTYLNSLINYYYDLSNDQQSSAKSEQAFKPFSFATLPDPAWWTCDLRDEDVCQITWNVKSAADGLYGVEASERSFGWTQMGEQPKYAQLWNANRILSIIATDLDHYSTTGHLSGQSSTFKQIDLGRYEINSDTSGILDILQRHRTEPMLAKFGHRSGTRTTRQVEDGSTAHGLGGRNTDTSHSWTAAGRLVDADERRVEIEKQQLVEQANIVQKDIATLARCIHEYRRRSATTGATPSADHLTPAPMVSGQNSSLSQGAATVRAPTPFPSQPTASSFATRATHATLANQQMPPIVLPHDHRAMPSTHSPAGIHSAFRGTPPMCNGSASGTGYKTLAYTAGAAAVAWAGYRLYKGEYINSAANSVASWWSGDLDEERG